MPDPPPSRPAWIEVDLDRLRRNFALIRKDAPPEVALMSVVKDDGYGHGAVPVARVAAASGATMLAVSTLEEGLALRRASLPTPILMLGERPSAELPWCLEHDLTCCVNRLETAIELDRLARAAGRPAPLHVKIDTGMGRYGIRWTEAAACLQRIHALEWVQLDGVMSHFAMSDEADKTFARLQHSRFQDVLEQLDSRGIRVRWRHLCNSGGLLDLPWAHYDLARLGILPLGVFPSQVCRRIPGIEPVMSVKCRIAAVRHVQAGDNVGYGLRYSASSPRRIGVLPVGYGDGYPRVRNTGHVLAGGRRAPIVGANAMDAIMVDLTDVPGVDVGDETVLMGAQGSDAISVHDLARWGNTVSYHVLCGWRARLPRVYRGAA